ncbi:histidine kinase [candidate division KSB3 bacterium]|uniref:histidine kinase n=1 Tax=candidate division KSB3 bacterium TaxID=2044937 RepID=A0A2G6KJV6_9BACT|nr:MAG: histidine kinase [candidate division KSB3 bacterium]
MSEHHSSTFYQIFEELHHFHELDSLLQFITQKVQELLHVAGAMVILADEEQQEFFFRVATLDNQDSSQKLKEIRFPIEKGVAGQVYKTDKPLVVPDTSQSPYFFKKIDEDADYETRNMLDVPIETGDHRIGVLCAVNKSTGNFTQADVGLLNALSGMIALPLENARINEQLKHSYEDLQSLNRAKDRVIHHLSHELKTPASVLSASLALLQKRLTSFEGPGQQSYKRILDRAQRNLQRILDMQYEIEDILREKQYTSYHMLSTLLDACVDELDVLITDETGEWSLMQRVRRRVDELFGPQESIARKVQLDQFVEHQIERLRPRFSHRTCRLSVQIKSTPAIQIPPDVLAKVVEGLLRNAIENTPDGSKIELTVRTGTEGPSLEIKDFGIGISEENQRLIFENYFPSYETMQYSSKRPYDFQAGGKGFDLLRMKIFSERYHFTIRLHSRRCSHSPEEKNVCPGDVSRCTYCRRSTDCLLAGGTTVVVQFLPTEQLS